MIREYLSKNIKADFEQKFESFKNMAVSTIRQLSTLSTLGMSHSGKRNLETSYGWPKESQLTYGYFKAMHERNGFANTLVSSTVRSCWRDGAYLYPETEREEPQEKRTKLLEKDISALRKAGLYAALEQADIEQRLGHYAVIYIGIPGEGDPVDPLGSGTRRKIEDLYFSIFSEPKISVTKYDGVDESGKIDPLSKRPGQPEIYTLTPGGESADSGGTINDPRQPVQVHWSRIIHMAEGATTNPCVGMPYLKPIIDAIVDHRKTRGGSGEGFFRRADPKYGVDIAKDADIGAADMLAFQEAAEKWLNEMQSFIGMKGASIKTLSTPMESPTDTIHACIQEYSAYTGKSLRMITGEGGGQYVGNEDRASLNQIVEDRQNQDCALWFMRSLKILELAGFFKIPKDAVIGWPIPEATDELTKSEVEKNKADAAESNSNAIATHAVTPGADTLIGNDEFMSKVIGIEVEEAVAPKIAAIGDGEEE